MSLKDKANRFFELHQQGTLVLPNAWDAASAALMAGAGAKAIATTSSGVSWSVGAADGEGLKREAMIDVIGRIVRAVDVPVTGDVEGGYGSAPSDVAATIEALTEVGAVGANIEDRLRTGGELLWSIDAQCERLAAARDAAGRSGRPFVLNARTDVYLAGVGEPGEREAMTLERGERYREAGAACLFVPGLLDPEAIARLVKQSPLPINIMLVPGVGPGVRELIELGVRRISIGGAIAAAAYGAAKRMTAAYLKGDPIRAEGSVTHPEMQALMAR